LQPAKANTAAMAAEREQYLGAKAYERSADRRGHGNGYKSKTVVTRLGKVAFDVPQVREGGFYPQALEKGTQRVPGNERALMLTLAEMYVQSVSTRKVAGITERLCGHEVSSMQVSRATAQMDEVLEAWRTRPLDQNAGQYVPRQELKAEVAADIRAIFNAPNRHEAEALLRKTVEKYTKEEVRDQARHLARGQPARGADRLGLSRAAPQADSHHQLARKYRQAVAVFT
jgi:transposase-like protein